MQKGGLLIKPKIHKKVIEDDDDFSPEPKLGKEEKAKMHSKDYKMKNTSPKSDG